ncbi:MAG: hypothetical protein ACJ76F_12825 [Bacteroidia bacterium]
MRLLLSSFFLLILVQSVAQKLNPSNVNCAITLKDGTIQYYRSELLYIQIDEGSHEIRIRLDLSTFKTEHDSVDEWLHKVEKKVLKYKGTFPMESLVSLSNHNTKEISSNGDMYINKTHQHASIKFVLMNVDNSLLVNQGSSSSIYLAKLSFIIELNPDNYHLNFKHHAIAKPLKLSVGSGEINKYEIGSQDILDYHPH